MVGYRKPESAVQGQVMLYLRSKFRGKPAFYWKASDKYIGGIPDIVGVYRGQPWAIELKVPGGRVSSLQQATLIQMREAGYSVTIAYGRPEVISFIEALIEEVDKRCKTNALNQTLAKRSST